MRRVAQHIIRTGGVEAESALRAVLGLPDPWKRFRRFERSIHPETWTGQAAILESLDRTVEHGNAAQASMPRGPDDPHWHAGWEARERVLVTFRDSWRSAADQWRVLIH